MGNKLLYAMEHADRILTGFLPSLYYMDVLVVFCQVLFPEKSVEIPCFRQGIFPTFGGH